MGNANRFRQPPPESIKMSPNQQWIQTVIAGINQVSSKQEWIQTDIGGINQVKSESAVD